MGQRVAAPRKQFETCGRRRRERRVRVAAAARVAEHCGIRVAAWRHAFPIELGKGHTAYAGRPIIRIEGRCFGGNRFCHAGRRADCCKAGHGGEGWRCQRRRSGKAFAAGTKAFEGGKTEAAVTALSVAISTGGLKNPELAKAMFYRGVALSHAEEAGGGAVGSQCGGVAARRIIGDGQGRGRGSPASAVARGGGAERRAADHCGVGAERSTGARATGRNCDTARGKRLRGTCCRGT